MYRPPPATGTRGAAGNAYLLMILTTLMWGANAVAGRMAIGEISPMSLTALRWLAVMLLIGLFVRRRVVAEWPVLRPRLMYLTVLGTVGFTAFVALIYTAAHFTAAINIGIIQGSIPVLVLIGAYFLYRTPVTGVQALGVAVTLVGVAIVAARGDLARLRELAFNQGDLLMMAACVLYAVYTLGLRGRPPASGLAVFSVMAVAAVFTSLPLIAIEAAAGEFFWPTAKGWVVLVFVAVFPSFLAQLTFLRGVELIGPGRAGIFINLVPVFAAGLGVAVLGERFELYHGLALGFVLGGIWLAERGRG